MKVVEPSHKEIMEYLNCCWYSHWNKGQCECHDRSQFKDCYDKAKQRLTRHVYTEEEIKQQQLINEKAMSEIDHILSEVFD